MIVSLQHYTANLPFIRNDKRAVTDIMISVSSLRELNMTFKDVIDGGLESAWVAANAIYFNTEDNPAAVYEAAVYIREVIKGE